MDKDQRIADLEAELKRERERIAELMEERDHGLDVISQMREHVEEAKAMVDQWIEAHDMSLNDKGVWCWPDNLWQQLDHLADRYHALLRDWNKFVPDYNSIVAPKKRNFGRPLHASPAQQADVLKRRLAGESLRAIAVATGLSLRTVRSVIDKKNGVDRATLARLERIAPDRAAQARMKAGRRIRGALPKKITEWTKETPRLLKAAKGLEIAAVKV
jgi:hypothetical protein